MNTHTRRFELKIQGAGGSVYPAHPKHGPRSSLSLLLLLINLIVLAGCWARPVVETFSTGLDQPRGMAFDAAGQLYVAEAGAAEDDAGFVSPAISYRSRVSRIAPDGASTPVVGGLPYTNYITAGDIGATDVAVLGDTLYVLVGEGYDDELSRAVLRIGPDGSPEVVTSVRKFLESAIEMDSAMGMGESHAANPYAMAVAPDGESFYISDGASGRVLQMTVDGDLSFFVQAPGMPPLTGLSFGPDGALYVALLSSIPLAPGTGAVWRAEPSGTFTTTVSGLTMAIDVDFDAAGAMYVLEFGDGGTLTHPYSADSGRLLRIEEGDQTVILEKLNYPTAMVFSTAGDLYIAINGAFSGPGEGAVLSVPCRALGRPAACRP
jgi:DNA-binding beta-propeller fold protein YncE